MNRLTKRQASVDFSIVDNEEGTIEGLPIVFNSETIIHDIEGDFREIIKPDALVDCDMKDMLLCINHDIQKIPLARTKNGHGTMSTEITEEGLKIIAKLDIVNNTEARAVYSSIKRGDLNGMSFMFRVAEDEWSDIDSNLPLRVIKKISIIHEVSIVNFPAYEDTKISARCEEETENLLKEIKKSREDKALIELEKTKLKYLLGE